MNKVLNKRNGIAAGIIAVVVIAAVIVSTSLSSALTLDEAKEIAKKYVPAGAKFVTSEEEENKFEVMFHDDKAGEGFEVEVNKETKAVKKVESQLDNDMGSETVKLKEADVEKIIKEKFEGVTSVSVTLNKDNGLYEYEADFKADKFYGDADVHPVSGVILDSTIKFGTAVTIPTDDKNDNASGDLLTSKEVEALVLKKAGGGFVKDMDLERENGTYYYEVEVIKDNVEYDYYINASTGEIVREYEHNSYFDYDDDDYDDDYVPSDKPSGGNSGGSGNNSSNGGNSGSSGGSSSLISAEKAKSIVLAKIPGATIVSMQLEKDDGIHVYEGEAKLGDYEYDFEINASSGVIIGWEKDRIDADDDWDDDYDDDEWDD